MKGASEDYLGGKSQQEALRAIMQEHNLTGAQVGEMVGVDGRTVRRWLAPENQDGHRAMPYAVWFTLISKVCHSGSSSSEL